MKKSRILSWLLIVAMVFSLLPAVSFAEGESTLWKKVSLAEIQPSDTVAITMTKEGTTYALPTVGAGSSGQPLAVVATTDGEVLSTAGAAEDFGWTIEAVEGGYNIHAANGQLYIVTGNNCVRIGETAAVWTLHEGGYLTTADPDGNARYLGVYAGATPDWRAYKTYDTGNIAGETLNFWISADGIEPPETTVPTEPDPTEPPTTPDPTEPPTVPDPTEPPTEPEGELADLITEIENGQSVYIYNPRNKAVLTAQASGTQLASIAGTVENDQLLVAEGMEAVTLSVDADGYYSFQNAAGEFLTFGGSANQLTFEAAESDGSLWAVEAAEGGFFVKSVSNSAMALEYYKGNFTVYSFQSYNSGAYLMQFFAANVGGFTDTLTAGDRVVIYNPTHSMGLSSNIVDAEKNQDLAGTELVLSNDSLSGFGEEHIWTVGVNEDGTYSFTTAAGQKLAVVNRTHLGFSEENAAWTLEKLDGKEDEFFVKGPIGTYLEWYADKGYWSAFYNPTEELYAVRFYVVGGNVTPSNTVATPKASPRSGVVDSGTEISFSCATEGASILYRIGEGEWVEYTAPIAITEDTVFTVKAVKEGMEDSKEVTFTYTIYVPPVLGEKQAQLVTDVSQLASGDQIIIVTKDFDYSLGVTQKANNRDYGQVIKAYDRCSYDEGTQIITLESGVEANTFALYATNGDFPGYLYASTESGNLLRTQEEKDINASFTITIASDGTAAIVSKADKGSNTIRYNTVGIFSCYGGTGQKPVCIYKLDGQERPGLPQEGDVVVIYNQSAKGVLSGMEGDIKDVNTCFVKAAAAKILEGKADCSNGALLFKVEKNGEYYRFFNPSFGYLCSTGTGNNAFYTMTASEDADWLLEEYNGGYTLGSRTAAFEGNRQFLQYYSEGFTTWGMTEVIDRDIFTYSFYPCSNEKITDGVVNEPKAVFGNPGTAYAGQKYLLRFTVEALFGIKELHVFLGETELESTFSNGRYSVIIPADLVAGESLTVTVKGLDNKGVAIESSVVIEVKDEPTISDVTPIPNAQTKDDKRPVISAKLSNTGENPTIVLTVNGETVEAAYADSVVSYQPAEPMEDGSVSVSLTVTRADGKVATKSWSFTVGEAKYQLLYGQLHAHTGYSDGAGTLDSALEYIADLPEDANVDFVAFTDHSNYFDTSAEPNPEAALFDASLCTPASYALWNTYKTSMADFNASHDNIIAIPGFEMTWSGGPGHMNTFVTEGIVSRNNKTLNNKSADAGMRAYYDLISTDAGVDSITQLNHPGTMFGNFANFAYWNPLADTRVYLVEVGNGEGPIHGGGYYPSYDQYTLALDKGWHIAPTNNQDNHKAKWGNGNEARDVILAESFSEEAIYEAIRNYRVYATEDRNLELSYMVNDLPMGTIIETVPGKLSFAISMYDPDSSDSIVRVELIVNSGKVAYTWDNAEELASGTLTAELDPEYSYYYVRVTQADKDLAVTAPIWVGESLKLGARETVASTATPVVGEELTLSTTFYNEETADAVIKNVVYTTNGNEVLYVDNNSYDLSALSEKTLTWNYVPTAAKLLTITVTAVVEYEGKDYTFSTSVELDVQSVEDICYVGIDASHANEYVTGYNKDLIKNFVSLATASSIRTQILNDSAALIAACNNEDYNALVITAPSRRQGEAKDYSEEELAALAAFHNRGGMLIITGGGDSNDKIEPHTAATQNRLLEALSSSLRLHDDGTYEDTSYGLSFGSYGQDPLTEGLDQPISYYGGSTVYAVDEAGQATQSFPAGVSPILFANAETISKDADNDGKGGSDSVKYSYDTEDTRLLVMAVERFADKGMILVAGASFMNDYDLKIPAETGNNAFCEVLFGAMKPVRVTPISEVRAQTEEGYKFTIEGVVTSNASGYDKTTAFFDCIYVQDETAGINCFPVAGDYKLGDVLRVTGQTEAYQGEPELQVQTVEKLGETEPVEPKKITAAQLNDRSVEGMLVSLEGVVTEITEASGLVESIYIKDEEGTVARIFIDGYITMDKVIENLKVKAVVTAIGLASYDNTYAISHDSYARLRVRDRGEVVVTAAAWEPEFPFTDVPENLWYREAVEYVFENGLMNGMNDSTFAPDKTLNRAMVVTILYRIAGSPEVSGSTVFTDVAEGLWYADAVQWGYENGVVKGVSEDRFAPDQAVTREQMVTFLYRYAKLAGYDVSAAEKTDLSGFEDAASISGYAADAFAWAVGEGIVNGVRETILAPQNTATRGQMAKIIMEYDRLIK
ncbi:MAG: S-layer homology domain-containing protein [Oscillospiraceae bacterium]|nr:S-layer homology domain-containing protein [Oscillospiraceae bacterium]